MTITDAEMAAQLAPGGFLFLRRLGEDEVPPYPLPPMYGPASALPEHGRFDSPPVDIDDPDLPTLVKESWFRMANEYGLLDDDREFLLGVDYADPEDVNREWAWAQVRLLNEWNLGGGDDGPLPPWMRFYMGRRFVPEFTVMALDGRMMMNTTLWGNGRVSTIAICPTRMS
ncbi:hypothetical protein [Streptomyces sp. NPDC001401]|uniref:hypothetical protein n=1 Tax=Streptomyces sp. NPDC001401 TaxID=3364570 RepID=UPI0036CE860A